MSQDGDARKIINDGEPVSNEEMGGDPSCWLHLFCAECGVQLDGTPHQPGCTEPASDEAH